MRIIHGSLCGLVIFSLSLELSQHRRNVYMWFRKGVSGVGVAGERVHASVQIALLGNQCKAGLLFPR